MPEHRIRFRGAWDWHGFEGGVEVARRVTLPAEWPATLASPFRLLRRFGRPPFDPALESAGLELLAVPGLVSARLNGREIARPPIRVVDFLVPLVEPLMARNALVLEVDFGASEVLIPAGHWGSIALVIAPRSTGSV